jgi:hypothetical protein
VNFRVGHLVRVNDNVHLYAGRQGVVASIHEDEVGVDLSGAHGIPSPRIWFLHSELSPVIAVTERPLRKPPQTRQDRPGGSETSKPSPSTTPPRIEAQ